ncbi:metallophosphoesterase family protein [Candidatus Dependentiae bacterium]
MRSARQKLNLVFLSFLLISSSSIMSMDDDIPAPPPLPLEEDILVEEDIPAPPPFPVPPSLEEEIPPPPPSFKKVVTKKREVKVKKPVIKPFGKLLIKKPVSYLGKYPTVEDWVNACEQLSHYKDVPKDEAKRITFFETHCFLTKDEFLHTMDVLVQTVINSSFGDSKFWVEKIAPDKLFFEGDITKYFVNKVLLDSDAEICVLADIHGDIRSTIEYVKELKNKKYIDNNFKVIKDNVYLVFLGDFSDRGYYGLEVLCTVARLKIATPEKVFLLRGNHEDVDQNRLKDDFTLVREYIEKFMPETAKVLAKARKEEPKVQKILERIYRTLPLAIFVSYKGAPKDYGIICHGGLEVRFNPKKLLDTPGQYLYQIMISGNNWGDFMSDALKKMVIQSGEKLNNILGGNIGFMWNDFYVGFDKEVEEYKGRGFRFGRDFTKTFLTLISTEDHSIRFILRGHQHSGEMFKKMVENHGIYNAWTYYQWSGKRGQKLKLAMGEPVWTLNVTPDSMYGEKLRYTYATYGVLRIKKKFKNWTLEPRNIQVLS